MEDTSTEKKTFWDLISYFRTMTVYEVGTHLLLLKEHLTLISHAAPQLLIFDLNILLAPIRILTRQVTVICVI
jgi:hypothetical protein